MMKIVVLAVMALGFAACTTTEERVSGAGAGALTGAVVAGPIGAAVGGVAGAVTGPTVSKRTGIRRAARQSRY